MLKHPNGFCSDKGSVLSNKSPRDIRKDGFDDVIMTNDVTDDILEVTSNEMRLLGPTSLIEDFGKSLDLRGEDQWKKMEAQNEAEINSILRMASDIDKKHS